LAVSNSVLLSDVPCWNDPDIILADEPTEILIRKHQKVIRLLRYNKTGRAVIAATHNHTILKNSQLGQLNVRMESSSVKDDEEIETWKGFRALGCRAGL
jgi:ABC-type lipoprotein export system ATPase subunit